MSAEIIMPGQNDDFNGNNFQDGVQFSTGSAEQKFLKGEEFLQFSAMLGDEIAERRLICLCNNQVYLYNGFCYELFQTKFGEFRNLIFRYAQVRGVTLNAKQCDRIIQEIIVRSLIFTGTPNEEDYTVFRNGYLSNLSGEFFPRETNFLNLNFPPDYFPTIYVDADYLHTPFFHCPVTDSFLSTICGGDADLIQLHWEFWGYALSSDACAKVIFFLYGSSGNNGKSTEIALLTGLLSPDSVDQMNLKNLVSRFSLSRLHTHRLEISPDEGALNLSQSDIAVLKSISGHDYMTADVKFSHQIHFRNTCKLIISSNHNIGSAYTACDPAFARRLLTIPYPVSIPQEQQDPYILDKMLSERDMIVSRAMWHYLNLKKRGYVFTIPRNYPDTAVMLAYPNNREYELIQDFSNRLCDFSDPDAFTYTEMLYQAFMKDYGSVFADITGFSQAFYRINSELKKLKKHTTELNAWGFQGVTLKG